MKTIPGIKMRGGCDGDKTVRVVCGACHEIGYVLPEGERLSKAQNATERVVKCSSCGKDIKVRVVANG